MFLIRIYSTLSIAQSNININIMPPPPPRTAPVGAPLLRACRSRQDIREGPHTTIE